MLSISKYSQSSINRVKIFVIPAMSGAKSRQHPKGDVGPALLILMPIFANATASTLLPNTDAISAIDAIDDAKVAYHVRAPANLNHSQQFLTRVDLVLDQLVKVHNAFWAQGQWYNMTLDSGENGLFGLFYDKPAIKVTTDPTGVYGKQKQKQRRELPFIYQSAPPAQACKNAASTSIISGGKAVDFASFAIGIMTLVLNINNNINNNNNNNNNLNLNAVDSSNIVANFNTNNANQVNVMPGAGKRRKRSLAGSAAIMVLAAIKVL